MTTEAAPAGPKPAFPTDYSMQAAAVMAVLAGASAPLDAEAIARCFKQGRQIAPKASAALAAMARVGLIVTSDGGKTFALTKAA